jgi:hypothetical protein
MRRKGHKSKVRKISGKEWVKNQREESKVVKSGKCRESKGSKEIKFKK